MRIVSALEAGEVARAEKLMLAEPDARERLRATLSPLARPTLRSVK